GALMHLALDVLFNGALTPNSIAAFYSFAYRGAHGFEAAALLGTAPRQTPPQFWRAFFVGAQPGDAPARVIPVDGSELAG
ncbi:MAG: hypothetical protein HY728_06390, partial [Candidatus Rokubacteria bacterium]|nr:hypothetical protein [Candidatus Rokubacteria bacterium]